MRGGVNLLMRMILYNIDLNIEVNNGQRDSERVSVFAQYQQEDEHRDNNQISMCFRFL